MYTVCMILEKWMRDRVTLNVTHATAVARNILWRCLLSKRSKKRICKGGLRKTLQRKSRQQTNRETILIHLKQKLFSLGRLNCIYMRKYMYILIPKNQKNQIIVLILRTKKRKVLGLLHLYSNVSERHHKVELSYSQG